MFFKKNKDFAKGLSNSELALCGSERFSSIYPQKHHVNSIAQSAQNHTERLLNWEILPSELNSSERLKAVSQRVFRESFR